MRIKDDRFKVEAKQAIKVMLQDFVNKRVIRKNVLVQVVAMEGQTTTPLKQLNFAHFDAL
jgi:hypothetical protein